MRQKPLSTLESKIMDIVWKHPGCSVRDVQGKLGTSKRLAYTTVATVLHRLHDKGLVGRKNYGKIYIYTPRLSKETYGRNLAQSFLRKFFGSFGEVAIASFAQTIESLPKKKRQELLKMLGEFKNNEP